MIEKINELTTADTIYIAGPMTGIPKENRPAFYWMQDIISDYVNPAAILNPARQPDGLTYAEYMRRALADLDRATAVVFLKGWEQSKGALFENLTARFLGLRMYRQVGAQCPNSVLFIAHTGNSFRAGNAYPWAEVEG